MNKYLPDFSNSESMYLRSPNKDCDENSKKNIEYEIAPNQSYMSPRKSPKSIKNTNNTNNTPKSILIGSSEKKIKRNSRIRINEQMNETHNIYVENDNQKRIENINRESISFKKYDTRSKESVENSIVTVKNIKGWGKIIKNQEVLNLISDKKRQDREKLDKFYKKPTLYLTSSSNSNGKYIDLDEKISKSLFEYSKDKYETNNADIQEQEAYTQSSISFTQKTPKKSFKENRRCSEYSIYNQSDSNKIIDEDLEKRLSISMLEDNESHTAEIRKNTYSLAESDLNKINEKINYRVSLVLGEKGLKHLNIENDGFDKSLQYKIDNRHEDDDAKKNADENMNIDGVINLKKYSKLRKEFDESFERRKENYLNGQAIQKQDINYQEEKMKKSQFKYETNNDFFSPIRLNSTRSTTNNNYEDLFNEIEKIRSHFLT